MYDVFKYIDTNQSLAMTDFAKSVIGVADWESVIPGFDPSKLADRTIPAVNGVSFVKKGNTPCSWRALRKEQAAGRPQTMRSRSRPLISTPTRAPIRSR